MVTGLSLIEIRAHWGDVKTCTVQVEVELRYFVSEANKSEIALTGLALLTVRSKLEMTEVRLGDEPVSLEVCKKEKSPIARPLQKLITGKCQGWEEHVNLYEGNH